MQHRADLGQPDQMSIISIAPTSNAPAAEEICQNPGLLEKLLSRLGLAAHITTEQYAEITNVKAETIRSGYCRTGNYLGVVPKKLPNRRLAWPAKDVARLLNGEEK